MSTINLQKFGLKKKEGGEEQICYQCSFCNKLTVLDVTYRKMCERMSGERFFCPFCLRHGFDGKDNKDVLILTFRGIIAYLYYTHYCFVHGKLTVSQIQDAIEAHQLSGLENPVFSYDPQTYLWFVNFTKVGVGRKKLDLDNILSTIKNIANCFDYEDISIEDVLLRFEKATRKFYEQRTRPPDQKILCPTFSGICDELPVGFTMDMTRTFMPDQLVLRT